MIDGRTDVYAPGCEVYEMLVGAPPFTARTPRAILAKHANAPLPAVPARPAIGARTQQAVTRALGKAPADRVTRASELVQVLEPSTL